MTRWPSALVLVFAGCAGQPLDQFGQPRVTEPGTAASVDSVTTVAVEPRLAVTEGGAAIVVWQEVSDAFGRRLRAVRAPDGETWGTPETIATRTNDGATSAPEVALGRTGAVVVVWAEAARTNGSLFASTRDTSWSTPIALDDRTGPARFPSVALDAEDRAVVVWQQDDLASHSGINAVRRDGGTWSTPVQIGRDQTGAGVRQPQVALDAAGNAIAVWIQEHVPLTHASMQARASRMDTTGRWSDESGHGGIAWSVTPPRVAAGRDGQAFAVWSETVATPTAVRIAPVFLPTGLFDAEQRLQPAGGTPVVAVNASGQAVVAWTAESSSGRLWVARGTTAGFETARAFATASGVQPASPAVALDDAGNAALTWVQDTATTRGEVWAVQVRAGSGWDTPRRLQGATPGRGSALQMAADGAGNVVVVWTEMDGSATRIRSVRLGTP